MCTGALPLAVFYVLYVCTYIGANSIKIFVLDEANEMPSYGFKDQIYGVSKFMPPDIQVSMLRLIYAELKYLDIQGRR